MENLEIRKAKLEGKIEGIESILKFMHLQPFGALMNDDFLLVENFANSALDTAKLELESIQKLTDDQKMTYKVENPITGSKLEGQEIKMVDNGVFIDGLFFDARGYNFYKQLPGEIHFVDIEIVFV